MNLLIVLIPNTAVVVSSILGALAVAFGGLLAFVIVYRTKQKSKEPPEEVEEETAYADIEVVPTEKPDGKLEKTYAPLFDDEFRENYDADYYVTKVKPKDIDTSSDVYKVDEEKIAAELDRAAGRKHKKPAPQIQTVGVANKFVLNNAIEQAEANQGATGTTTASTLSGKSAQGSAQTVGGSTQAGSTQAGATNAGAIRAGITAQAQTLGGAQAGGKTAKGKPQTLGAQGDSSKDKVVSFDGNNAVVIRGNSLFHIQYLKSYSAKLVQADKQQKKYYSDIKNELMAYGLKPRTSWRAESFRLGRKKLAVLVMRGKTMCLLLNLDPKKFDGTKYKVEDMSKTEWLKDVPCLYRLKNPRRAKYAMELIAEATKELSRQESIYTDYSLIPDLSLEELISQKLIKLVEHIQPVTPTQANVAMTDEVAKSLIEDGDLSDRRKIEIINIDDLSDNFASGEKVTLDEVKKRIKGFNKKATALKVLARGSLNKALTVEADDFSIEAVKMIALTGGKIIKKRRNG